MPPLPRPAIGRPAPDVELLDASGRRWSLRDQRGQPVLLVFHRHIN